MPLITTAGDLIAFALRTANVNGVGQTPLADDSNTGLQLLNNILAEWQRRRWLVWSLADTSLVSTGAATYTIGTGGAFNIARPDKIDSAFARLGAGGSNPLDYPLAIIPSREDYNSIVVKGLSTFPQALFFESAFPLGVLHFWPIPPSGTYELHVFTKQPFPAITLLTSSLAGIPPEYMSALLYSLTVELSMNFGLDPKPAHVGKMREALNVIRMANVQMSELACPVPSGRGGSGLAASSSPGFMSGGFW